MAVELSSILSAHFIEALQARNTDFVKRIARYAIWAWSEGAKNESLSHMAMDIARETLRRESLRLQLWTTLDPGACQRLMPLACGALGLDTSAQFEREYRFPVR